MIALFAAFILVYVWFTFYHLGNFSIYIKWISSLSKWDQFVVCVFFGGATFFSYAFGVYIAIKLSTHPHLFENVFGERFFLVPLSLGVFLCWNLYLFGIKKKVEKIENHFKETELSKLAKEKEQRLKEECNEDKKAAFILAIKQIGLVEKVTIAKNVVQHFPSNEYEQIEHHLIGASQKSQAISEFNEKLKEYYQKHLIDNIGDEFEEEFYKSQLDETIVELMKLGFGMLLKKYGMENNDRSSDQSSGREISKTGKWKDIKQKL